MINIFTEEVDFDRDDFQKIKGWIKKVITEEKHIIDNINYIFSHDDYVLKINKEQLNHDYYTDIITFPYKEGQELDADIYISVDRVKENAKKYSLNFDEELRRVMIHGILHMVGYDDKSENQKEEMRKKENYYLEKY